MHKFLGTETMEFSFKKEISEIMKTRYGNRLTHEQVTDLGLYLGRKRKAGFTVNEVVEYIDSLQRIGSGTIINLFKDFDVSALPETYKEAILYGSPIFYQRTPCKYGHSSIRTVSTRRCLTCAENELRETRLQKALKTIETQSKSVDIDAITKRLTAMSTQEKAHLLESYLNDGTRAADFFAKAAYAGLLDTVTL